MLRRPIIILSEDVIRNKNGEAISVNDLYGIYLPTLSSHDECIKEPIVLAYDRSHFCALQPSDIGIRETLDNFLPLYLSIDCAYDGILLPIRFSGDDENIEHTNNLLHDYLQAQKKDFQSHSDAPSLSILCTKLSSKTLIRKENIFYVYYEYIKDFFEVQKPKAIEEERIRERQRELGSYVNHNEFYDTRNHSIVRRDPLSSSSISALSTKPIDDVRWRKQDHYSHKQYYLSDDIDANDVYIPYNGPFYVDNLSTRDERSRRPLDLERTQYRTLYSDHTYPKQAFGENHSGNVDNLSNCNKIVNTVNVNLDEDEFKIKRGKLLMKKLFLSFIEIHLPIVDL